MTNGRWNPDESCEISPEDYEQQALQWLANSEDQIDGLTVVQRDIVEGDGGDYEIDVVARFTLFGGAHLRLLVECKRWSEPLTRDHLLAFYGKLDDTSSHKGIVFCTAGFQSGALQYAANKEIATVTFTKGGASYETKGKTASADRPPPWGDIPQWEGTLLRYASGGIQGSRIDDDRLQPIADWLDIAR